MSHTSVKVLAGLFYLVLMAGIATADEFHYNNFLIGDRASGMGGAYTAVSDDPTGLYYNPAGIVYATGRNLSASVNAYYTMNKKYNSVIGGNGWERNSSSLLPNYFGICQPIGSFQFGFSYAVPDSIMENQDQTFTGSLPTTLGSPATRYVINFNNEDNTYLVGPSLATEITGNLSFGMTLYLHNRTNRTIMNQLINLEDGRYEWSNLYVSLVERGYKPVIGLMWAPVDKVTVGLSVSRTFLYGASRTSQSTLKDANAGSPNDVTREDGSTGAKRKYPYEIRGGVAYFASNSLLLSLDGAYYTTVTDSVYGDRVNVLNGALGTEYYFNRKWAARAGMFTNLSNAPKLDPAKKDQPERIDIFGGSLSISNFTRNTSVTFGGSYSVGSGEAQIIGNSTDIQHVETVGWTVYLSSSYTY